MIRLHDYWRSGASYRVRIALNLKGIPYESVPVDLRSGEQNGAEYRMLNPQELVPALELEGKILTQSPAILEWLEERYPEPRLLPVDPDARAVVRAMAALIACDIHPLNNLRVLNALRSEFAATDEQIQRWIARWITSGFDALETMVKVFGNGFAFGNTPTLADCHLVPQMYSAQRFRIDLASYPRLCAAAKRAHALPAFDRASPVDVKKC
ncbi:MAG TPA: maleylacetoacetate isomerase [Rhizomicrobium sp.]|nr:maleylacetoacetate isomerase [Rhizomicrobium sp.]